jgi:RNA polymerase sigma factor (sigma-70 family)
MDTNSGKETFVQFIQENKGVIFKVCNSYCSNKSDIEDLSQEIVYNLWKSFHSYDPALKFSTWMYRVALNVAISFYRKEKRSRPLALPESLITFNEYADTGPDANNDANLLLKFIGDLKEIDRSIMLLYLEDKSYKEIAEITGITESNVATRINRIKDKLRTKFLTIQK